MSPNTALGWWIVHRTACPASASRRRKWQMAQELCESRPLVGSSRNSSSRGRAASSTPMHADDLLDEAVLVGRADRPGLPQPGAEAQALADRGRLEMEVWGGGRRRDT
ncbi:hypothetical protein VTK73DRAFT_6027 [Phialemonium thermophilum]|uniref:Uncharacterized protein n=1 Tax=Phialemonium thermophilum TaxID=223376 RepID=A0ABR3V044_9PEZI